jgi:hypothetical protein
VVVLEQFGLVEVQGFYLELGGFARWISVLGLL